MYILKFVTPGQSPSLLDLVIWPWFERLPAIACLHPCYKVPTERFPNLIAWQKLMLKLCAVKTCLIETKVHAVVLKSFADKQPNYGYKMD